MLRKLNWRHARTLALRCLFTVLIVSAATALLYILRNTISAPVIALLYLLPVGMAATAWGIGCGVLAALGAFVAFNYFFIQPQYTLAVAHTQDILVLLVFLVVAIAISQLMSRAQSSLAEARAREHEVIHLYELITTLAGLRNEESIARTTAGRLMEVFGAKAVEVVLQPDSRHAPVAYRMPANSAVPLTKPDHVEALLTPRGLLGEIHLWHGDAYSSPSEERLLTTFAGQAALALERTALAQTETRAKVLEESDRLKSALLSSVSHELRTPLATIKAAITSLRSGAIDWDSRAREDLMAEAEEETDHLNHLVGNLLDMSRIEAGVLKPQRQWNILADILSGTLSRMRHAAEKHRLEIDVSEDLPLVPVDYTQLDQVFTNLISNCLKYAPPDTIVRVSASEQDHQMILIEVSNEGPHVLEQDLDRIFDKFYRVTEADRVTGTGLGLSICKGIVEAHGGRIWAQNLPTGFAFFFTLPLTLDGEPPPHLPAAEVEAT